MSRAFLSTLGVSTVSFIILANMKWVLVMILMLPVMVQAQTEDEFLPEVTTLVIDSNEKAVQKFCKEIMSLVTGYKPAFVDRENVMMSKYYYDNSNFESIKFEFQFGIDEVELPDSTIRKSRVVRLVRITAEITAMTNIYNYIFSTSYTPEKIMAISRFDKAISYKGKSYNSTVVSDDFKAGYWILSFFKL